MNLFKGSGSYFLAAVSFLLLASLLTSVNGDIDIQKVKDFMKQFGKDITYEQIKKWFADQLPTHASDAARNGLYPRLFPICVTPKQIKQYTTTGHHLQKFGKIIEFMYDNKNTIIRPAHDFNNQTDTFDMRYNPNVSQISPDNDTFAMNWIKNLSVSRINTPEPDMVNLRQWMHVRVESVKSLKGLYVQSIVGPLGLPFGEFNVDFPCKDNMNGSIDENHSKTKDIAEVGHIANCFYRPRTAMSQPLVYVGVSESGRTRWDMHFKWSDITCMETPYIQFLLIAVVEFANEPKIDVDFKPVLSHVWLNTLVDTKDGAPYPYYPTWKDDMTCFQTASQHSLIPKPPAFRKTGGDHDFAAFHWKINYLGVLRIQPNEAYDLCVSGLITTERNDTRFECPPGPFECDQSYAALTKNTTAGGGGKEGVEQHRQNLAKNEEATKHCKPCVPPACLDLGFPIEECIVVPSVGFNLSDVALIDHLETKAAVNAHGLVATLGILILIPIANFMARFYKEVCSNLLFGNGPWLYVHIIGHVASLVMLWICIGPVAPQLAEYKSVQEQCWLLAKNDTDAAKECAIEKSIANPHVSTGILCFTLQHLIVGSGFHRSSINSIRVIQVIIHSHGGYAVYFVGALSAILAVYNNPCSEFLIFSVFLILIPIIFFGVGVALDIMTDQKLGIEPKRKQWPVLEPIKIEGKGPFTMVKWLVLGVLAGLLALIWLLQLGSYTIVSDSPGAAFKDSSEVAVGELRASGLFGECGKSLRGY